MAKGPRALRDAEVLALLVGSGTRGVGAVELSRRILKKFGGVSGLAGATADELCAVPGVGPALASRLLAARELARRAGLPDQRKAAAEGKGTIGPASAAPPEAERLGLKG